MEPMPSKCLDSYDRSFSTLRSAVPFRHAKQKLKGTATKMDDQPNYVMNATQIILRTLGAWPLPATSPLSTKIQCRVLNLIAYFLLLFTIVPGVLKMFLKETTGEGQMRIAGPLINCIAQLIKFTIVLYRAEGIKKSLVLIRKDWIGTSEDDRQILRAGAIMERRIGMIFLCIMYGGGMGYRMIVPLLKGTIVTPDNITIRPLACPVYFIVLNEQDSPIYEITFLLQCLAGFTIYAIMTGSCGICAFLALHVCNQLKILANKLTMLVKDQSSDEKVLQQRIVDIVDHRTKIRGYLEDAQTIMDHLCFVETLCATFLICCVGYYMLLEWDKGNVGNTFVYSILVSAIVFSVFIHCYIGQILDNENNNVGLTAITLDWYRLPTIKARCLILVIAISNYPMKLTAGKIVDMSLTTFTDIMKASMGYLNLLREVI